MIRYHPHLYLIIPGGALSDNDQWLPSRQDLFVHTKPLEIIFKAKFKDAMKKAGLLDKIDPAIWKQQWVSDSQAAGQGQNSLRYLSRYVFRVAVSNNRIKSIENGVIKFSYKDRKKKKWKIMALNAMEFIRRFLQHVLPKGFMKIRHYGFLNPSSVLPIEKIREPISFIHDIIALFTEITETAIPDIKCSHCGHILNYSSHPVFGTPTGSLTFAPINPRLLEPWISTEPHTSARLLILYLLDFFVDYFFYYFFWHKCFLRNHINCHIFLV